MLETIMIVLLVLWALGYFGGFVASGFIHVLLVTAVVVFIVRVFTGRRVV